MEKSKGFRKLIEGSKPYSSDISIEEIEKFMEVYWNSILKNKKRKLDIGRFIYTKAQADFFNNMIEKEYKAEEE